MEHSMSRPSKTPPRLIALTLAALPLFACPALADVSVSGPRDAVVLKAQDASLDSVLGALRDRYGLVYHGGADVPQNVTGTYRGSLESVLRSVMRRVDYAIRTRDGQVELILTNQVKSTATATPATTLPSSETSAVTAALENQTRQLAAAAAATPGAGGGTGGIAGQGGVAGQAGSLAGARPGAGQPPTPSAIADMTQRASATVKSLAEALQKITPQIR